MSQSRALTEAFDQIEAENQRKVKAETDKAWQEHEQRREKARST